MLNNPYEGKTIEEILALCNAVVVNNHFVYKALDHGPAYVNKDEVYTHPEAIFEVAFLMAKMVVDSVDCSTLHCVVGPATAGAILTIFVGYHLTKLLGREIFTAYADKDGEGFVIKRGYGKKISGFDILAIDDIVNSGASLKGVIEEILKKNGNVLWAGSMCNRGGITAVELGLAHGKYLSLMDIKMEKYKPEVCPLCAAGVPINTELGHGKAYLDEKNR
jgi:orotate phosphoribosyltransferase